MNETKTEETMTEIHPETDSILRHFAYAHLPGPLADISSEVFTLAHWMVAHLPSDPELTAGLRHLLEAKDCFVRAVWPLGEGLRNERDSNDEEGVVRSERELCGSPASIDRLNSLESRMTSLCSQADAHGSEVRERLGKLEQREPRYDVDAVRSLGERVVRLEDRAAAKCPACSFIRLHEGESICSPCSVKALRREFLGIPSEALKTAERVTKLEKKVVLSGGRIQKLEDDSDEQGVDTRRRLGSLEENEGETADRFDKAFKRIGSLEDQLGKKDHEARQRIAKLEGKVSQFLAPGRTNLPRDSYSGEEL